MDEKTVRRSRKFVYQHSPRGERRKALNRSTREQREASANRRRTLCLWKLEINEESDESQELCVSATTNHGFADGPTGGGGGREKTRKKRYETMKEANAVASDRGEGSETPRWVVARTNWL